MKFSGAAPFQSCWCRWSVSLERLFPAQNSKPGTAGAEKVAAKISLEDEVEVKLIIVSFG